MHIALLLQRNAHSLFRAHHSRDLPFPALPGPRERYANSRHRRQRPVLVEMIGTDDQVVEITRPHNRSPWLSGEQFAAIPGKPTVRVLRYRVRETGSRSREIVLMTTLLDAVKYPAADVAELYKARRQIEVNFPNLKQTLGMNTLHSKTVEGVTKEMPMFALVYNALCAVMCEAARGQNVPVDRISFIDALRWIQLSAHQPELPRLRLKIKIKIKINPPRPGRLHPRMFKRRLRYPTCPMSRSQWREKSLAAETK